MNPSSEPDPLLALMRDLSLALCQATNLEEALLPLLEAAIATHRIDSGSVYLVDAHGALDFVGARGAAENSADFLQHYAADSLQARVVGEGRVRYWVGGELIELGLADAGNESSRVLVTLPVMVKGRAVASFNLAGSACDRISEDAVVALDTLAALAALAVMRARAEGALQEREEMFRSLYEKAPLPYQSLDAAGNILEVNEAWQALFGHARADVLGHSIAEFLEKESLPTLLCEFPAFKERGYIHGPEFRIVRKNGETRLVTVTGRVSYDAAGEFARTQCLLTDVTEQRQAEAELAALLAQQKLILENAVVGLAVWCQRRLVSCNSYFAEMLGYAPAELIGQSAELIHLDAAHFAERGERIYAALAAGRNYESEERFRRKDGSAIWMQVVGRTVDPTQPIDSQSVWIFVDISERKAAEARLEHLAHHDPLTGLDNRYSFERRLAQALMSARREGATVAVMFIDMDRFKLINDTLGHHVGDGLLVEVATRLRTRVRGSDIVARLGGDEFVLVLTGMAAGGHEAPVADKILNALAEPYLVAGHTLLSGASIGISVFPVDGSGTDELMKNADIAMYKAKQQGRNNVQFFATH